MLLNLKLILLSLLIIFFDSRGFLVRPKSLIINLSLPFETIFAEIGSAVFSEYQFWRSILNLKSENLGLKTKVDDLEGSLLELKGIRRENELLQEQLKVQPFRAAGRLAIGRVIGKTFENPNQVLVRYDSRLSLREGSLVVFKSFLVGKVVSSQNGLAKVRLTVDPESVFSGVDIDGRQARGEVRGNFGTALRMEKILPTEEISVGDTIVEPTVNLILGKVERVESQGAGIFKSASLSVPFAIDRLEKVLIVLDE